MFVALDQDGKRVYADIVDKKTECFCPECSEKLKIRRGGSNRPHFAHYPGTECKYGNDKDNKSEWHIRMQEYFPREAQEVPFVDEENGETHRADVFLEDSNIVIEFQHSPITEEEFMSRTMFHTNNGRRIAWLFDESKAKPKEGNKGRFRPAWRDILQNAFSDFYSSNNYIWERNPRSFISKVPPELFSNNKISICVYTGDEDDVFHRIINLVFADNCYAVFSVNSVEMTKGIDAEDFFRTEDYWLSREPYKEKYEWRKNQIEAALSWLNYSKNNNAMNIQTVGGINSLFTRRPKRRRRF